MSKEEFVFARPPNELSCIIGSLLAELNAPCEHICKNDEIVLCGTTFSGNEGILVIRHDCCRFYGEPSDIEQALNGVCIERKCGRGRNTERIPDWK